MKDYQKRVVVEKGELDKKLFSLCGFIVSKEFQAIDTAEQARLRLQKMMMELYSEVLTERITNFKTGSDQ